MRPALHGQTTDCIITLHCITTTSRKDSKTQRHMTPHDTVTPHHTDQRAVRHTGQSPHLLTRARSRTLHCTCTTHRPTTHSCVEMWGRRAARVPGTGAIATLLRGYGPGVCQHHRNLNVVFLNHSKNPLSTIYYLLTNLHLLIRTTEPDRTLLLLLLWGYGLWTYYAHMPHMLTYARCSMELDGLCTMIR